jgi:hypothetical protein
MLQMAFTWGFCPYTSIKRAGLHATETAKQWQSARHLACFNKKNGCVYHRNGVGFGHGGSLAQSLQGFWWLRLERSWIRKPAFNLGEKA